MRILMHVRLTSNLPSCNRWALSKQTYEFQYKLLCKNHIILCQNVYPALIPLTLLAKSSSPENWLSEICHGVIAGKRNSSYYRETYRFVMLSCHHASSYHAHQMAEHVDMPAQNMFTSAESNNVLSGAWASHIVSCLHASILMVTAVNLYYAIEYLKFFCVQIGFLVCTFTCEGIMWDSILPCIIPM